MTGEGRIETRFLAHARRTPRALALASRQGEISYAELERLSRRLAAAITAEPGGSRDVVAILAERGPAVVVAALACLRAARPFVILDQAYPAARLRMLTGICRPGLVIDATQEGADQARALGVPVITAHPEPDPAEDPAFDPPAGAGPADPAYLLFTSGSTGTPKCVACSHRPLLNFVDWQGRTFGLTAGDRFTLLSGLSHDPVLRDIFTPLSLGASIHIPEQAEILAPGGLHAWFARTGATAAHMTPQLGHLLTTLPPGSPRLDRLRHVFWGGDMLRQATVDALAAIAPACESVNFYGATETPQAAAFHRARAGIGEAAIPIGVGVDGFRLEVEDEDGRPAAAGQPGQIVVHSDFLTLGYVEGGRLPSGPAAKRYATGDIGHRRPDGQVVARGRADDQVKIRGFRVEMAELTACALKFPGVGQAVTLDVGPPGDPRLTTFVEAAGATDDLDVEALKAHFAASLPAYMIPERIVPVDETPLLPNGKIDRQRLILDHRTAAAPPARPAGVLTPAETRLTALWTDIFRSGPVTPDRSFASLGGDSLSYVNAYLAVEQVLGHVPAAWTTMTVRELAALAGEAGGRRGLFVEVESAITLRALAIAAVVASHFHLIHSGGAATSTLFWISGFLFGGLQLHEVEQRGDVRPMGRLLKSVLIPTLAIVGPIILLKALLGHPLSWPGVFLYADLIDFTGVPTVGPNAYAGHDYMMWYIHCMVHILVLLTGLLWVFHSVIKVRRPVVAALAAAVGIGLLTRFVLPGFFLPDFWRAPVEGMSIFGHSPTAHLATFTLAALTGYLRGRWQAATWIATLAYVALSIPSYGLLDSVAIAAAATLLFLVPKLPVPRLLQAPIYLAAGASLFIYLLHFKFLTVSQMLGLPAPAALVIAMVGGVAAWSAWNWGMQRLGGVRGWAMSLRPARLRAAS